MVLRLNAGELKEESRGSLNEPELLKDTWGVPIYKLWDGEAESTAYYLNFKNKQSVMLPARGPGGGARVAVGRWSGGHGRGWKEG